MNESAGELLTRAYRALGSFIDHEQTMRTLNDLSEAQAELGPLVARLRQVSAGFAALGQAGEPVTRPQAAALAAQWRTAAAAVRDTGSLPQSFRSRHAADIERRAREDFRPRWRSYVESRLAGLAGIADLASTLEKVRADPENVRRLQGGLADLEKLARQMPDAQSVRQVAETVDQVQLTLAFLVGGSDEIRRFIDDAAKGGAPIWALTPAVRDWMRAQGLESSFRVVPGRPVHD